MAGSTPDFDRCEASGASVGSKPCRWSCFVLNSRRGHYEFGIDRPAVHRLRPALDELMLAI